MPNCGIGPRPRPSVPPRMIWQTAELRIISDGSFMLPVPRRIAASVFISHGSHRAAEEDLGVADRVRQHIAAAAEQFQQRRAEDQHAQHEGQPETDADQQRVRGQRRGAVDIAGTERARDRRRHAAAHRAARHRHGQDHEGKHQRHRRQRLDAEPADIGGLGDHHAGAGAERDDVRPGQPQQRAQDRAVEQRIPRRRGRAAEAEARRLRRREFRRRRYRTFRLPGRDRCRAGRLPSIDPRWMPCATARIGPPAGLQARRAIV